MNCKSGDLALVVGGKLNLGKMVRCIELLDTTHVCDNHSEIEKEHGPIWFVDKEMIWEDRLINETLRLPIFPDKDLMPIRPEPEDSKDEETEDSEKVNAL